MGCAEVGRKGITVWGAQVSKEGMYRGKEGGSKDEQRRQVELKGWRVGVERTGGEQNCIGGPKKMFARGLINIKHGPGWASYG